MNQHTCTVKRVALFAALFAVSGLAIASANMLRNGSFETQGADGEFTARSWKMNDPDEHGEAWGSATRQTWRAHEGTSIGTIRGTWAKAGDFGGWWQEAEATVGMIYRVTAQFYADANWKASTQELKLEFWNADRSRMLGAVTNAFHDVGETWTEKSVDGTAPIGTVWVRAAINVSGAGEAGALQIDEVDLDLAL
ncbi:MAG: hypothetical protein V1929_12960 [bacterium]